jgi:hypothetical protein
LRFLAGKFLSFDVLAVAGENIAAANENIKH